MSGLELNDLGINLEEDSEDISEEDVRVYVDTSDGMDLVRKVLEIFPSGGFSSKVRRKNGVLYSILEDPSPKRIVFRTEWLKL